MLAVGLRRVFGACGALLGGIAAALGVAACGHHVVLHGHRVAIAEMEYRLRPARISGPGSLTITVDNLGRQTHNFVVAVPTATLTTLSTPTGVRTYTTTVAARTPDLAPGQASTLTVALDPGRYAIASTLNGDEGQGMQGSLTVTSK